MWSPASRRPAGGLPPPGARTFLPTPSALAHPLQQKGPVRGGAGTSPARAVRGAGPGPDHHVPAPHDRDPCTRSAPGRRSAPGPEVVFASPRRPRAAAAGELSTVPPSPRPTRGFPQPIHKLCTSRPTLPTTRTAVDHRPLTDPFTTRPVDLPGTTGDGYNSGVELGMDLWTTGDRCGSTGEGSELSTTRSSQSPVTSRGHPHRATPHDQRERRPSPQLTALTTTAVFISWKRKGEEE